MSAPFLSGPADSSEAILRVARMFMRVRQPRAAALLFLELIREAARSGEVWCGLGAALLGARTPGMRRTFERWAAMVLRDAEVYANRSEWAAPVAELRVGLPAIPDDPFTTIQIGDLERLLLTDHVDLLPDAIDHLPAADRLLAATALIEHSRWAIAVTCAAIDGRWGPPGARAALRRSDRFVGSGAVRASIEKAASSPRRDELEPFLGYALDAHRR